MDRERYADRYSVVGSLRAVDPEATYPDYDESQSKQSGGYETHSRGVEDRYASSGGYPSPSRSDRSDDASSGPSAPSSRSWCSSDEVSVDSDRPPCFNDTDQDSGSDAADEMSGQEQSCDGPVDDGNRGDGGEPFYDEEEEDDDAEENDYSDNDGYSDYGDYDDYDDHDDYDDYDGYDD